jgi:hypothetical protein
VAYFGIPHLGWYLKPYKFINGKVKPFMSLIKLLLIISEGYLYLILREILFKWNILNSNFVALKPQLPKFFIIEREFYIEIMS